MKAQRFFLHGERQYALPVTDSGTGMVIEDFFYYGRACMKSFAALFLHRVLVILALIGLTSCAGMQAQPAKVSEGPALKFALAAGGLPESGIWKCTPVLADINRDGHLDILAISRLGDGTHVWLGDGKGNWKDSSQGLTMKGGSCGGGIAYGDINKDGRIDLAVGDHCSGIYVYLQQPDASWQRVVEGLHPPLDDTKIPGADEKVFSFFMGAEDLAMGDINEDGCLDLVVPSSDQGGFAVYLGDCSGKNWKYIIGTGLPSFENPEPDDEDMGGWANRVILADINKDGHLDVLASYYKGPRVWLGDGKAGFKSASEGLPQPQFGGLYRGLDYGDLNEDGLLDIVAANDVNGPEAYLQLPNGTWRFTGDVMPSMQNGAVGIALGDFTHSGHLDIVVAGRLEKALGSNYGLYYLQGDGKGNFKEIRNTDLPAQGLSVTWGVAVGDVNEDGRLDFIAATGGKVAGAKDNKPKPAPKPRKGKEGKTETPTGIAELPLPRMQAWLNQGVK